MWTINFQIFKPDLEKAEGPEINIHWIMEKAREFQENIYFCFIDYAKAFVCITTNCGKSWKMGLPDHLICLLRNLYAGQEATVKTGLDMEQQTGSKLGKAYVKAVCCHPAYLTSMQSTSCEIPGWMIHKLESRLLGEISTSQICRWQRVKRN